jgi:hypothetical protein
MAGEGDECAEPALAKTKCRQEKSADGKFGWRKLMTDWD